MPKNGKTAKQTANALRDKKLNRQEEVEARRLRQIGTHDGRFHADEVLACYMLTQLKKYKDATIISEMSHSISSLQPPDGTSDANQPHRLRVSTTHPKGIPLTQLSSAGLIYAHFGKEVIKALLTKNDRKKKMQTHWMYPREPVGKMPVPQTQIDRLYEYMLDISGRQDTCPSLDFTLALGN
ncbi:unnamed protein product [Sphagnum balticum]